MLLAHTWLPAQVPRMQPRNVTQMPPPLAAVFLVTLIDTRIYISCVLLF